MYMRNKNNRRRGNSNSFNYMEQCHNCRYCKELPVMPENPLLANAYVPFQYIDETSLPMESLINGTTFPELVSPYTQNQSQCIINYLSQTETCEEVDPCE